MMMISIPPDLRYRNLHSLVREPDHVVSRMAAAGCIEIDVYAFVGLRLLLDRWAGSSVTIDLPRDRRLAARFQSCGLLQDLRFVVRGASVELADAYRGVPLTRLSTAADVERFAADVLVTSRVERPDLAANFCAAAAEAGDNAVRHATAPAIGAMEIKATGVDLVVADAGAGIRATFAADVGSDGDALLAATGGIGRTNGGLADIARRWPAVDGAEVILRSGHAGLVLSGGTAKHEEHGSPIRGTWMLIHVSNKEN
ncbi:MAG TPA: hypothetical protein VES62_07240 [Thermoleophilaceae bacterium]|nr:hypothetical protein [Thermoleophilaceae bacterium]